MNSSDSTNRFPFIVITGGPGAGKTAFIESLRRSCSAEVALLPEAADILYKGGFWRLSSPAARRAIQRAIFHVQREIETLVEEEKKWNLGVCDRGSLDGLAYWAGTTAEFYHDTQTSRESEYDRYYAVIHLRSPSSEMGYNHSNPFRIESALDAYHLDLKIAEIWKHHPRYFTVDSKSDFFEKMQAARKIFDQLNLPQQ